MSEQNDTERDDSEQRVGGSDKIDAGGYGGPGPENELPDGKEIETEDNRDDDDS
ncbi:MULTISPECIES: hypothetical protein [unclassified Arthrobacter]|uniref:hypothetical protein n=1 Tax=unclassified Arthrobacter TaxID=235627 RepID=UPI001490B5EF|nr:MULTISPECIES: hypothetical protein [unclassified Arthrobacter]NOJ59358.1 hypothetical protein [Arthrobacter sp. 260]NOJ62150.1 hypothetical protein [Arthrobacter sp. 147(2020)]